MYFPAFIFLPEAPQQNGSEACIRMIHPQSGRRLPLTSFSDKTRSLLQVHIMTEAL
jgi:hypothetical protein